MGTNTYWTLGSRKDFVAPEELWMVSSNQYTILRCTDNSFSSKRDVE
jgi:hypothetical protein